MKLLIAIPSRSRPEMVSECALSIPLIKTWDTKVFVEPEQYGEYCTYVDTHHLIQLPKNNMGNEYACNCIYEYAKDYEYDLVLKIDDDVRGFVRRFSAKKEVAKATLVFQEMITDCLRVFEQYPQLGGIGFPYSHQMFELKRWLGINQRLQTCYMVRAKHMATPYSQLHHWEDFYRYLRILNANQFTLRYGYAGIECEPVGTTTGGCQDYDRSKQAKKSMAYLNRVWPGLQWKRTKHTWEYEPDFKATKFYKSKAVELALQKEVR